MSRKDDVVNLLRAGPSYIYEMAQKLNLKRQHVERLVYQLIAEGVIERCQPEDRPEIDGGPPRQYYRLAQRRSK